MAERMSGAASTILERSTSATALPDSPAWLVGTALVLVVILVALPAVWRISGLVVTIVHELGHGFAGLLTGRRSVSIRLSGDHAGLTTSTGTKRSVPWTTFWGYPVPAVVGAALVIAGMSGWAGPALAVCSAVLVASLLFMRGILAWLMTPLTAVAGLALLWLAPDPWLTSAVVGIGLFLVVGAARALGNLVRGHARGRTSDSDAAFLARDTRIPAPVWLFLFTVVIAAAAIAAAASILSALGVI